MTRVLLIGMGSTALSALDSLATKFIVLGIVRATSPGSQVRDPVVAQAQKLGIPVFFDLSLRAIADVVTQLRPDCVVVSSYNRILPPDLIAQCPFVNVHYAPLPRYRGRATVNWALINGDACAAITIHTLVPALDAGNILFQQDILIRDEDTVADLYEKLNTLQRDHLAETVERFLSGYVGIPQHSTEATYGCSRIPADGEIDWTATTHEIYGLIRALVPPFPGAYTYFQGQRLTVWKAQPVEPTPRYEGRVPGRVISTSKSGGCVDVLTGNGTLRIFEVQLQGENRVAAASVIKSVRGTLGLRTSEPLERIQTLERHVAELVKKLEGSRVCAQ